MKAYHQHCRHAAVLLTCVISLVIAATQAAKAEACQPRDFQWVRQIIGANPSCVVSDSEGGAYIGGVISGPTADFGILSLPKSGVHDPFVAKYDASGRLVYAVQGGNADAYITRIALDSTGSVIAAGYFQGTLTFGSIRLTNLVSSAHGFVVKVNAIGEFVWGRSIAGLGFTDVAGVAMDGFDNCIIAGQFQEYCALAGSNLTSVGRSDAYIAKLTSNGELAWLRQVASPFYEASRSLSVTAEGEAYLAGEFRESVNFGSTNLYTGYPFNCFVAKFSPVGDVVWAQAIGGPGYCHVSSSVVDAHGDLYLGGYFSSNILFSATNAINSKGPQDIFFARFGRESDLKWLRTIGAYSGPNFATARSVAVAKSGIVYLAGDFFGTNDFGCGLVFSGVDLNAFLMACGADGGLLLSQQWGGYSGAESAQGVAPYGTQNCYVVGYLSSSTAFGTTNLLGHSAYVGKVVPIGAPNVFLNNTRAFSGKAYARGLGTVSITTSFAAGTILYTLDGSDPTVSGRFYNGPFQVKQSALLRVVAYNGDFTQFVHADPVEVVIVPTMTTSTDGGGTVAIDPLSGAYASNGTVTLTATPLPGWTFLQWLGDATGTNPVVSVEMSKKRCVQAVFGTALSTAVVGSGTVAVSPTPTFYPYGSNVRLTALPASGAYLALWGNAASGTNNPLTFSVTNANPTVTAVFASLAGGSLRALAVQPTGAGSVQRSPYSNTYTNGARVTLTAVPEPGQQFLGWTGAASGTSNPLVVTLDSSKVVGATFTDGPRLVLPPCADSASPFRGWLMGGVGAGLLIESTIDLPAAATNWVPVATLTNSLGTVQFEDASATNSLRRFYRGSIKP